MSMKSSFGSKYSISALVSVMILALIGIIIIQYLWIDRTVSEKQNLIDEKVYQAIDNVDQQLSDYHLLAITADTLMDIGTDFYFDSEFNSRRDSLHHRLAHDKWIGSDADSCSTIPEGNAIINRRLEMNEDSGATIKIELNSTVGGDNHGIFRDKDGEVGLQGFHNFLMAMDTLETELHAIEEVSNLFEKIAVELRGGITGGRLDSTKIGEYLNEEFKSSGLEPPNAWSLYDDANEVTLVEAKEKMEWNFDVPLFTNDVIHPGRYHLKVNTSNNSKLIWADIRSMIIMSLLFISIIFVAFVFAIRLVIKHKKISQIKSDFINNMTHEFKTPLASISIAADSIVHPNVRNQPEQIDKYIDIIQAEKSKLNDHVERILEVASLDKDALTIPTEKVSLNEIVKTSTQKLSLLLEEHQVNLSIKESGEASILGNEFYLERVFTNIIENSIKYKKGNPEIAISIAPSGNDVEVSFTDNGIGMDKKQIEKVFDNFYRAETGNVHNTKGFGLGLSYAKLITEKLKGSISMEGQVDKGCTVKLRFPLAA